MAAGGSPDSKEDMKGRDARHACSICMEPYPGRSPKILPCFHSFCLPCLTELEAAAVREKAETGPDSDEKPQAADEEKVEQPAKQCPDEKEETANMQGATSDVCDGDTSVGQDGQQKAAFLCPTCRAPVTIPKGGVAFLQTNFYVYHELNEDNSPPPVLCDMCEEEDQQPATHRCQQCQVAMCRTCRRCHDKLMPKHHVAAVSPGQSMQERKENTGFCLVHQDQKLCFHCAECDLSICLHCKLKSHDGHQTNDMASAVQKAKKEISSLITVAEKQLQVMESSMQQMDCEDRQLIRNSQEMTQKINARLDVLVTWANKSRDQLVEDVSGKERSARSQLSAEKASTKQTRDTISALLSQAVLATGTDPNLLVLKNDLKAALLSDDKLEQHKQQSAGKQKRTWRYDVSDASILHEDDVQAYMGQVVEGQGTLVTRPLVSLRELTDKVDRWMKEMTDTTSTITAQLSACEDGIRKCATDLAALKKDDADLQAKTESVIKSVSTQKRIVAELETKTTQIESLITRARQRPSNGPF